jgi:small subunit ribosomal protein S6
LRLYEAMLVVDSSLAERDWSAVAQEIESTVVKHGGKIVDLRKWDDRRLAYEIRRMKRALFVLVHFEAPPLSIEALRRDFALSERITRNLITLDEDGVPTGDERPGVTSTAIPDFGDRRSGPPRGDRDRGRGEEEGVPEGVEPETPAPDAQRR